MPEFPGNYFGIIPGKFKAPKPIQCNDNSNGENRMLKFSPANAKLKALANVDELKPFLQGKRRIYSLDILSGWSCPFAKDCLSKVVQLNGKAAIKDGPHTEFRCFSASQEALYPSVYKMRKSNFDQLRACSSPAEFAQLIESSLPKNAGIIRIHVAGDFFSAAYLAGWITVAKNNPNRLFYAYTKSLKFWLELRDQLPENLVLTASLGGRLDHLIEEHNLRSVIVVNHPDDTQLDIDHDDSHAARPSLRNQNFALLIHGIQPAGSEAAAAIKRLKAEKIEFAYSR
jgi:hypothetical protein